MMSDDRLQLACALEQYIKVSPIAAIEDEIGKLHDDRESEYERYSKRPLNPIEECLHLLKSGFDVRDRRVVDRLILSGKIILDGMVSNMTFIAQIEASTVRLVLMPHVKDQFQTYCST